MSLDLYLYCELLVSDRSVVVMVLPAFQFFFRELTTCGENIHSFISLSNLASTGIICNWKLNHPFYLACKKAWPKESMLEHNVPQHKSATCCCLAILQVFCLVTNYNPIERYGTVVFFFFFFHCLVFVVSVEIILWRQLMDAQILRVDRSTLTLGLAWRFSYMLVI